MARIEAEKAAVEMFNKKKTFFEAKKRERGEREVAGQMSQKSVARNSERVRKVEETGTVKLTEAIYKDELKTEHAKYVESKAEANTINKPDVEVEINALEGQKQALKNWPSLLINLETDRSRRSSSQQMDQLSFSTLSSSIILMLTRQKEL